MTSPSNLSILRVYLPDDLLDQVHALAKTTGLPMRMVVRGLIELGLEPYAHRWAENVHPHFEDELSDRPYQSIDRYRRREIHRKSREGHGAARPGNGHDPPLYEY